MRPTSGRVTHWWRAAPLVGAVTVAIYVTGLGPMLAIAYAASAAGLMRSMGTSVARPVLAWALIGLVAGELAVQLDATPSVLSEGESHAVAALAALALVPTILLFADVAGARERSEQSMRHLLELAGSLSRADTPEAVCAQVVRAVPTVVGLERAAVFLWDADAQRISVAALHGFEPTLHDALHALSFGVDDVPALRYALALPEAFVVTPQHDDPFVKETFARFGASETFVAPIIAGGALLGLVTADRVERGGSASSDLLGRLQALAHQAGAALEHTRLLDQERTAVRQLRESDRMKSEFLAVVSHELRTPLSVMMGAARTLQLRAGDIDESTRGDLVESVVRRGDQLNRLVEDLLQASSQIELVREAVDLTALARTAVADASSLHAGREITLDAPAEPVVVPGDTVRLRQVLDNLLANALKYAPSGVIAVSVRWAGDDAELSVRDTGPGMTDDQAARAFEPFYQGDSSSVRRYGGLGLGLHICRRIVDAHGGRIWIDSTRGAGTTVVVCLPSP